MKAKLILQDGTIFEGKAFGYLNLRNTVLYIFFNLISNS